MYRLATTLRHSRNLVRLTQQQQLRTLFSKPLSNHQPHQHQFKQSFNFNQSNKNNNHYKTHGNNNNYKHHQTRSYSPNLSQGSNTGALITGAAGTLALIAFGYYGLKYMNQPERVVTYNSMGQPIGVYTDHSKSLSSAVQVYLAKTFGYVGAGAALTATAAVAAFKSGVAQKMLFMGPMGSIGLFAVTIGAMYATRAINVDNTLMKHAAFATFNGIMGLSLCTLGFFAPVNILVRAGLYSLGIVGGLSLVAMNAKEERFLMWGGALSSALLVLVIASFGRMFLPARFIKTASALDNLWLYGGLALFGGLMLYDTQRVMRNAKQHEQIKALVAEQGGQQQLSRVPKPDYISESIGIYMNMINIFVRLVMILSNSKNKK